MRYRISSSSYAAFELTIDGQKLSGKLHGAKGVFEVDLMHLSQSRGKVKFDLASLEIDGQKNASHTEEDRTRALDWLDLGRGRLDPERERQRWTTFSLLEIGHPSAEAPHLARLIRNREPADTRRGQRTAGEGEARFVAFEATGAFLLHSVVVEQSVPLRAEFRYPVPATPGATPSQIVLSTRHPFSVFLKQHQILPRDPAGVLLASMLSALSRDLGRPVLVSVELLLEP